MTLLREYLNLKSCFGGLGLRTHRPSTETQDGQTWTFGSHFPQKLHPNPNSGTPLPKKDIQKNCPRNTQNKSFVSLFGIFGLFSQEDSFSFFGGHLVSLWQVGGAKLNTVGKRQMGGGKRIVRILGGEQTIEHALQNQVWRPQKVGLVWSVPFSSKQNDRAWITRGGNVTYRGGEGPKPVLGRGFMVCFPLPESSTPFTPLTQANTREIPRMTALGYFRCISANLPSLVKTLCHRAHCCLL